VQSSGGWGSWPTGSLDPAARWLGRRHPGLLGWSELGFGQVSIEGTEIPVMGILGHGGRAVEPPTTSGHPLSGPDQVEFGTVTMRQLGLHLGQRIEIDSVPLTVVGTVTLPSFGVVLTDHPSLGRGAMTDEATLLRILNYPLNVTPAELTNAVSTPAYPATVVFDASTRADASAIAATFIRNADNAPGEGNEGDFYTQPPEQGAAIVNASQMGSQPVALAIGVAAAAVLALALTILASVRERRRDLALLKALGLRSRQIRAVVGWQTTTILVIALAVGVPLGIAAGSWAWTLFANSIGVVPISEVPRAALLLGIAAMLVAGNLLALWPAHVAARIAPAATFRTE
jgi:ABC-type antimicrobial peptide transport system permease subunit